MDSTPTASLESGRPEEAVEPGGRPEQPGEHAGGGVGRPPWLGAVAVALLVGLFLRVRPMVRGTGAWTTPIDADNGVYYGAAALLWQGVRPYGDFTFLHPMGVAYLHAPAGLVSHVSVEAGFLAARWTAVLFGALTMVLLAVVLWRRLGQVAAVAGVALYAVYPEIVSSDRGPFLEPIQNLLGALLVLVWTSGWRTARWRMVLSGVVLGGLLATKYTSGLFLLACLVSLPGDDLRQKARHGLEVLFATCASFLVLMGPWLLTSPGDLWRQTVSAHLGRGDGLPTATSDRLVSFFDLQGGPEGLRPVAAAGVLAVACLVAALFALRGGRLGRFTAALFVAEVAFLLLVSQYWPQYNAILALPLALMAGWVAERCWRWLRSRERLLEVAGAAGLVLVALTVLVCARTAWRGSQIRSELIPELREVAGELPEGCVVGLPGKTLLALDQLPAEVGGRYLLDPYGTSLVETDQASLPAPPSTIEALDSCTSVLADPDWADALGPTIQARGYVPVAELPVEGRFAVVYVRPEAVQP